MVGDNVYVIGGKISERGYRHDMWQLDLKTFLWSVVPLGIDCGEQPPAMVGMKAVVLGSKLYLFGGKQTNGKYCNRLTCFDTTCNRFSLQGGLT